MRRSLPLVLALAAGAALFTACRDSAVAPQDAASPVQLDVAPVSFAQLEEGTGGASFTVTIDPRRETIYSDGINTVRFPAASICDPATSSYGAGTWDQPCAAATSPISLPVTLSLRNSRLHVEFGRDLRFVPSSNPARHVTLTVHNPAVAYTSESLRRFAIFYVPSGTSTLIDEAAGDPSLVTVINRGAGTVVRRLKHFTGYNVYLGIYDDCEPGVDEGCTENPEGTVAVQ